MNNRELFVDKLRAAGKELIENAEKLVGDCDMPLTSIDICLSILSNSEDYTIPTIDVTHNYISDAQYLVDFKHLTNTKLKEDNKNG